MTNEFGNKQAQELYGNFRKEQAILRKNGKSENVAKVEAFNTIYNANKKVLDENKISKSGFLEVMRVCHTFWCSRGVETEKDLLNEMEFINN